MCGNEATAPSGYCHLLLRPSPIAAGLSRVHAEDKPVRNRFIVGGLVHRADPTLLATEVRIQWQWMTTTPVVPCRTLYTPHGLLSPP